MNCILNKKLRLYTKELTRLFLLLIIALLIIGIIIFIKYKPSYKVSSNGEFIAYTTTDNIEDYLKQEITNSTNKNVDEIFVSTNLEYEFMLINRNIEDDDEKVKTIISNNMIVTYKYYEIAIDDTVIETVNTFEESEEIVDYINTNISSEDISIVSLSVTEKFTEDVNGIVTNTVDIAKNEIIIKCSELISIQKEVIEYQEYLDSLPDINGVKIAYTPVTGIITSRFATYSTLRVAEHTGLDIAATEGTDIQVIADGIVTYTGYLGSYGYIVKIDHGNGVESWYAHTSKMYVSTGDKVVAGDVIAAVGSTGNSTGAHLHIEIRINDVAVDPELYLYN